jgi:hypothetical protein
MTEGRSAIRTDLQRRAGASAKPDGKNDPLSKKLLSRSIFYDR